MSAEQQDENFVEEVLQVISQCETEESDAIQEFENIILQATPTIQQHIENLYEANYQLQAANKTADDLAQVIETTYEVAEGVSSKIRQLHLAHGRVGQILELVDGYINMKSCVEGVDEALKIGDFEKATDYVSKVMKLEKRSEQEQLQLQQLQKEPTPATPIEQVEEDEEEDIIQSNLKKNNDIFKSAEKKVKQNIIDNFQKSIETGDVKEIDRYSKLFVPLGLGKQGLQMYCTYITSLLAEELDEVMVTSLEAAGQASLEQIEAEEEQKQNTNPMYTDLLVHIFDTIAACVEQQEVYVQDRFGHYLEDGSSTIVYLVQEISKVCDRFSLRVLTTLEKKRNLQQILNTVKQYSQTQASTSSSSPELRSALPEPRTLDLLLEEISMVFSSFETYHRFIISLGEDALQALRDFQKRESLSNSSTNLLLPLSSHSSSHHHTSSNYKSQFRAILKSELEGKIIDLIGLYVTLDEYFSSENIKKAILMDKGQYPKIFSKKQMTKEGNVVSFNDEEEEEGDEDEDGSSGSNGNNSMHRQNGSKKQPNSSDDEDEDDILADFADDDDDEDQDHEKCSNYISDIFVILRKSIARSFSTMNMQVILAVLHSLSEKILQTQVLNHIKDFKRIFAKQKSKYLDTKSFKTIVLGLNNLDVCSEYILELKQKEVDKLSTEEILETQADQAKVVSFAENLVAVSNRYKEELKQAIGQIMATIKEEIYMLLESFSKLKYELNEGEYSTYESRDPFAQRFVRDIENNILFSYESFLTRNCFDTILQEIVTVTTQKIEEMVFSKKFTQWGGLQLDKDIRALLLYFSSKTSRPVRDKFQRLTQIASLLKLTRPNEVLEYWGQNAVMNWRLTSGEVRKVLLLRAEPAFNTSTINKLPL